MPYWAPAPSIPGMPPNAFVNGDCRIAQSLALGSTPGVAMSNSRVYGVDCFPCEVAWAFGTLTPTFDGQIQDHPVVSTGMSRRWSHTPNIAAPGVFSWAGLRLYSEGLNMWPFLDRPDTELSFQVKASRAGLHSLALHGFVQVGHANNYVSQFAVPFANVWQQIIMPMTFPSAMIPQAGADPTVNNRGALAVTFPTVVGASLKATASQLNTWIGQQGGNSGDFWCGPDFVDIVNGAYLQVTDVCLSFQNAWRRYPRLTFQDNLAQCRRYWQQTPTYGVRPSDGLTSQGAISYIAPTGGSGTIKNGVQVKLPVSMRAAPTRKFWLPNASTNNDTWWNKTLGAVSTPNGAASFAAADSADTIGALNTQLAADLAGHELEIHAHFDATLAP